MKVMRFMSRAEFDDFRAGKQLSNNLVHTAKTDAVGFVFLDADEYDDPNYAYHFLSGIVSNQVCAIFETDAKFKKGSGIFADPHGSFFQSMTVEELSLTKYSSKNFTLLKYCADFNDNYAEDSFDRIFDWQQPDEPVKEKELVVPEPPKPVEKPDTPEQRLVDAITDYVTSKMTSMPPEYLDGFMLNGGYPRVNVEHGFQEDKINIEVELVRYGRQHL